MLSARNIQNRTINFTDYRLISDTDFEVEHKRTAIRAGDVLMTIVGTIGRTAVIGNDVPAFALQRSVAVLRSSLLYPQYLSYALEAPLIQKLLNDSAQGTAQKGVYLKTLGGIEIPLAPLPEQKRIADKLDTVLARVDACRDRLDRLPALLKRFRQSILAAATSGRLTEDWRQRQGNGAVPWKKTTAGSLIKRIEAGLNVKCDERPPEVGEVGLVKISAVTWGIFNEDESKTLPAGTTLPEATKIRKGDFLVSRANTIELVGACVLVHEISRPLYLSDKVLRLVLPEGLKQWLLYVLRSDHGRRQIEALASGNQLSMRNLSQANLKSIEIPLPTEREVEEIIRRVEILFAFADRLEARLAMARKQVAQLTPALLAKAFRGELVPQDPADEPASELLKRLAAQRPETPKPKRSRKPLNDC